jgi:hypothetical protein
MRNVFSFFIAAAAADTGTGGAFGAKAYHPPTAKPAAARTLNAAKKTFRLPEPTGGGASAPGGGE